MSTKHEPCHNCGGTDFVKKGTWIRALDGVKMQRYVCKNCKTSFSVDPEDKISTPYTYKSKPHSGKRYTKDDIRKEFDCRFIIRETAKKIERDNIMKESEFIKECNFPGGVAYRDTLKEEEFQKYKGKAGGDYFWGHPLDMEELKRDYIMK